MDFPDSSAGKESTCNAGDPDLILGSGSSPGEGIGYTLQYPWASLVAQMVRNLPAMQETWVGKIPWRRAWQSTPVFLPGESPWTEEPGGLQSMGSQSVRHDWATKHPRGPSIVNYLKYLSQAWALSALLSRGSSAQLPGFLSTLGSSILLILS